MIDPSILHLQRHLDKRTGRPAFFGEKKQAGRAHISYVVRVRCASCPVVSDQARRWIALRPALIDLRKEPAKHAEGKRWTLLLSLWLWLTLHFLARLAHFHARPAHHSHVRTKPLGVPGGLLVDADGTRLRSSVSRKLNDRNGIFAAVHTEPLFSSDSTAHTF